ncbi:MAG: bacteriocin [Selenomonadaceae bacterium]|nr:bacteriocin [Selenomonadaceae bacterium]
MKDEKILQDEILSDEELENISGGTLEEYRADKKILQQMGVYTRTSNFVDTNVKAALNDLGKKLGMDLVITNKDVSASADGSKIIYDKSPFSARNNYFINNKLFSRDLFWAKVNLAFLEQKENE